MSGKVRIVAAAFGLTTICVGQMLQPLVQAGHSSVYHWSGAPGVLFGPVAVELAAVFLLTAALLFSAERNSWWRSFVWAGVVLFTPCIVLHQVRVMWPGSVPHRLVSPPMWLLLLALSFFCWFWVRKAPRQRETTIETASIVLAFVSLSGALFLSQFLWFWWQARSLNQGLPVHEQAIRAAAPSGPRIIWVVMDELSYRQVYVHRYPGIELPAFDRLAAEATVFTDVKPAANFTEVAIPALLSGKQIASVSSTPNGDLLVHATENAREAPFEETQTVFRDALDDGYRPAIAGWYNPYCRILRDVVDQCYWTDAYEVINGLDPDSSFRSNLMTSTDTLLRAPKIRDPLERFLHIPASLPGETFRAHLDDYRDLRSQADKLLYERSMTFTFLHMPIPHPNGIYDRNTHRLIPGPTTYIDNLVLADRYLDHLRTVLEETGQWDSSTIVLMGDHGWRTTLIWDKYPEWSQEEQRASLKGTFDSRPAYIVKLPGQKSGQKVDAAFDAVRTRALLDELMAGRIRTSEDLQAWVASGQNRPAAGQEQASRIVEAAPQLKPESSTANEQ